MLMIYLKKIKISAYEKRLVETKNVDMGAHVNRSYGLVHKKYIYCGKCA